MHIKKLELSDLGYSIVIARYINNNQNNNQIPQVCYPLIAYFFYIYALTILSINF